MSPHRLSALVFLPCAALLLVALPAIADVTIRQKTVSSGLGGFGDGTSEQTLVIAGDKSRSDDIHTYTGRFKTFAGGGKPRASASITRLDRELIWSLDPDKKQYSEMTFAEMREAIAKGAAETEQAMKESRPEANDAEMEFTVDVKRTGKKESVNGFAAEQVIVTVTGTPKDKSKKAESAEGVTFTMKMDQWLSSAVPGQAEATAYYRAMAEKMGMDPQLRNMGRLAMAQYGNAMKEMAAKLKDLKGYPVRSVMTIESAGPSLTPEQRAEMEKGKAEAAAARADARKKHEAAGDTQAESDAAGALAKGNIGGALGGLLGRKAGKAAAKSAESKMGAGASDSGDGPLFQVATDVISVSTGAAAVSFDLPAGYKKVESRKR